MTIRSTHHVNPDILYRSSRTIKTKDDFNQKKAKEEEKDTDDRNQQSSDQK